MGKAVEDSLAQTYANDQPHDAFEIGLLSPLRAMPAPSGAAVPGITGGRPFVIVVDGVDECYSSSGHSRRGGGGGGGGGGGMRVSSATSQPTIVDLLAAAKFPFWLSVIVTSGYHDGIQQQMRGETYVPVSMGDTAASDLPHYVRHRLCKRLPSAGAQGDNEARVAEISAFAGGNFLIATQLIEAEVAASLKSKPSQKKTGKGGKGEDIPPRWHLLPTPRFNYNEEGSIGSSSSSSSSGSSSSSWKNKKGRSQMLSKQKLFGSFETRFRSRFGHDGGGFSAPECSVQSAFEVILASQTGRGVEQAVLQAAVRGADNALRRAAPFLRTSQCDFSADGGGSGFAGGIGGGLAARASFDGWGGDSAPIGEGYDYYERYGTSLVRDKGGTEDTRMAGMRCMEEEEDITTTYTLFHQTLRDWFLSGAHSTAVGDPFCCDIDRGRALLAAGCLRRLGGSGAAKGGTNGAAENNGRATANELLDTWLGPELAKLVPEAAVWWNQERAARRDDGRRRMTMYDGRSTTPPNVVHYVYHCSLALADCAGRGTDDDRAALLRAFAAMAMADAGEGSGVDIDVHSRSQVALNARDVIGRCALERVCDESADPLQQYDAIDVLLRAGAHPSFRDQVGLPPLQRLVRSGDTRSVSRILDAEFSARDALLTRFGRRARSALHIAARRANAWDVGLGKGMLELILARGGPMALLVRDAKGHTPLQIAVRTALETNNPIALEAMLDARNVPGWAKDDDDENSRRLGERGVVLGPIVAAAVGVGATVLVGAVVITRHRSSSGGSSSGWGGGISSLIAFSRSSKHALVVGAAVAFGAVLAKAATIAMNRDTYGIRDGASLPGMMQQALPTLVGVEAKAVATVATGRPVRWLIDEAVREALEHPGGVEKGETALVTAGRNGQLGIARLLIERGGALLVSECAGRPAPSLWVAAINGQSEMVRYLLHHHEASCQQHTLSPSPSTPKARLSTKDLCDAICPNRWARQMHRCSMLFVAAHSGHIDVARALLESGANPDLAETKHERSPLMQAAWHGNKTMVKLLLQHGASLDATEKDGGTALMDAASEGHTAVVALLLAGAGSGPGADASVVEENGIGALHYAVGKAQAGAVAELLRHYGSRSASPHNAVCAPAQLAEACLRVPVTKREPGWDGAKPFVPRWTDRCFKELSKLRSREPGNRGHGLGSGKGGGMERRAGGGGVVGSGGGGSGGGGGGVDREDPIMAALVDILQRHGEVRRKCKTVKASVMRDVLRQVKEHEAAARRVHAVDAVDRG